MLILTGFQVNNEQQCNQITLPDNSVFIVSGHRIMTFCSKVNGYRSVSSARSGTQSVLRARAVQRDIHTRLIGSCRFFMTACFVFFAMGFSGGKAAPSQCESLEFYCVVSGERGPGGKERLTLEEIKALADRQSFGFALKEIERFLEQEPDHAEGRLLLGVFLIWRGESERAMEVFRKLADDRPDLAEPYNNIAAIHVSNGRYREAQDALEKAVSANPNYGIAWENLGDVRIRLAGLRYEDADKLYIAQEQDGVGFKTNVKKKSVAMKEILDEIDYSFGAREMAVVVPQGQTDTVAVMGNSNGAGVTPPGGRPTNILCYSVGPLPDKADSTSVMKWLKGNGISATTDTRGTPHGYQIFLPLSNNHWDIDIFVEKVRRDGIRDVVPVSRNAPEQGVTVGVSHTEEAARRRIDELWKKGYEAKYRPRVGPEKQYWVDAYTGADSPLDMSAFTRHFPAYTPRVIPCE
uniref:Tetratricopeptide repeat-containing protein n=1 Tax=Candidatus Kentrum sp. FW TaxID=2126338 RepID=A0A450S4H3_9GAMM|nr:MAG: Tetratricopeptide repeat-containing protein [Candidatus Kentron sp. FW]